MFFYKKWGMRGSSTAACGQPWIQDTEDTGIIESTKAARALVGF